MSRSTRIFKYTLLPEIRPRIRELAAPGFFSLAYILAMVYRAAGLIPPTHPFLQPDNYGRFGIRDAIAAAANNLELSWKNVDKIMIFAVILAGFVMMGMQVVLLLSFVMVSPATAQSYSDFFVTPYPETDLAFRLLDRVFGIPDLFGSFEQTLTPFHVALHGMMQLYSSGLLVIAVMILLYFIFAVAAETADTGVPFGKRFNQVWAPLRLVVAFGLLIPIGFGLNSGQYIALYAAKFGSGFASNGWFLFNSTVGDTYLGDRTNLVATPNIPDMQHLPAFMMVAHTCKHAYQRKHNITINAYLVINAAEDSAREFSGTNYDTAIQYFRYGDIRIRFGERDEKKHKGFRGNVYPYCGELVLQTTDSSGVDMDTGSEVIQRGFYELIQGYWSGDADGPSILDLPYALNYTYHYLSVQPKYPQVTAPLPDATIKSTLREGANDWAKRIIEQGVEAQKALATWEIDGELLSYGWGGAAIWYNKVAELNGSVVTAALNVPHPQVYPSLMEYTKAEKFRQDANVPPSTRFTPSLANGLSIVYPRPGDEEIATTLNEVFKFWEQDGYQVDTTTASLTTNAFIDAINAIFGTQGLFDMCKNADIHPLAQLSNLGKGLVESSIRSMGYSLASGVGGGVLYMLEPHLGAAAFSAAKFFVSIATIGLSIGFLLFYLLPFLPFIYYFFAVGGWIKGLFEAMVGIPLWALAHIRIDGQGLPGDAAAQGYFLIFEIFLRPILILFGLLAAIITFSVLVKVLNDIFTLVVSNLSGFDANRVDGCMLDVAGVEESGLVEFFRGPIDQFFFTVLYAVVVYMIGMSSFKLIDLIPNNLMRWMGAGVQTFNDLAGEPAEGLVQRIAIGGNVIGQKLGGAVSNLGSAAEGGLAAAKRAADKIIEVSNNEDTSKKK